MSLTKIRPSPPLETMKDPSPRPTLSLWERIKRDKLLLAFALPGIILILIFQYIPLLGNVIAFQDYQPFLGIMHSRWSGFDNFSVIFNGDPAFLNALKNTLIITALQAVFVFPAPILIALLLNSLLSNKIRQIVQSILYLPHFLSWVIVVAVFQQILGGSGMINNYLRANGHDTLSIIGNSELFTTVITSQVIWKDTGWATILFLAALAQIDRSLYEASAVDGASRWRQTWHITLPSISPVIFFNLILGVIGTFQYFTQAFLMTGVPPGGPANSTLFYALYLFQNAFTYFRMGYASAMAWVLFLLTLAATLLIFRSSARWVYYEGDTT